MKVIKSINNNVAICLDGNNNEVVVFGKGVGFQKPPYEISLSQIQRTYYDVDEIYIHMINDIPPQVLDISSEIIQKARDKLDVALSNNVVFTLADHISFAITRYQKKMNVTLPIIYDIQYMFETEVSLGKEALRLLQKRTNITLPLEEASYIALHIINAESQCKSKKPEKQDNEIIEEISNIIENHFKLTITKDGFNYSRFVTHMYYLLRRAKKNEMVKSENLQLYDSLVKTYPETFACVQKISEYLRQTQNWELTEEEIIYLMLHVNRLCVREDCYQ